LPLPAKMQEACQFRSVEKIQEFQEVEDLCTARVGGVTATEPARSLCRCFPIVRCSSAKSRQSP
jgi:hypothetical protein